ncbi:MAG: type 1 glutamine amidotransferase [Pseudomonadota bacterium]
MKPHFLIIDGYPKESRNQLEAAGMTLAWQLYANMLQRFLPDAEFRVWLPSDTTELPDAIGPEGFCGILWTGCNLTIYHVHEERVTCQIDFAKQAYTVGTPSFGSCWGIQMATVAAGGEVRANPRGREMGLARKIHITTDGQNHPMMRNKPSVYNAFISHEDEVVSLPKDATFLATNDFSRVQAIAVSHKKGNFWATQYHPEYNLYEMACLILAREQKLVPEGFFQGHDDLVHFADRLRSLHQNPQRKDLRWQLDIDDDVISADIRQQEFKNWLETLVLPRL